MAFLDILSGLGEKGPACFRIQAPNFCWVLDVGQGPEANAPFKPEWLENVDAVFITHDHVDHIGGVGHVIEAGLPIYCTAQTAKAIPTRDNVQILPDNGQIMIDDILITTGRNGHALGGVWLHFDLGEGLFYAGDYSLESQWFVFDEPPKARTAIIDSSYHLNTVSQLEHVQELKDQCRRLPGQIMFPVPPSGRAAELALFLINEFGEGQLFMDYECQRMMLAGARSGLLHENAARSVKHLTLRADPEEARFLICDNPNADGGMAWSILREWREARRMGQDAHVIFTGHMTAHARAIAAEPGGHYARWNVHPPLQDQRSLIHRLGAKLFTPAFCALPEDYLVESEFEADVFFHEKVQL